MGVLEGANIYGIQIRESANDGSDFSNAAADYRIAFLGEDGLWHVKDSSGTVTNPYTSGSGTTDHSTCQGRLTLTTGVPITTTDVTAATTLYFTPFRGNTIGTYSGSAWSVNAFTEKSITLAGLTAGLPYDVFIVDSTLALELTAWTNATTRATALTTQDGILVKTGSLTRRYLGTICIAATGQCEDSLAKRFVYNYYNRQLRLLRAVDTTDTWNQTATAWRQANATATNHQVEYIEGVSEEIVRATVVGNHGGGAGIAGAVGVGIDATTANSAQIIQEATSASAGGFPSTAQYRGYPGIGYHFLAWIEYRRAGTVVWQGDGGIVDTQSGIIAEVWA